MIGVVMVGAVGDADRGARVAVACRVPADLAGAQARRRSLSSERVLQRRGRRQRGGRMKSIVRRARLAILRPGALEGERGAPERGAVRLGGAVARVCGRQPARGGMPGSAHERPREGSVADGVMGLVPEADARGCGCRLYVSPTSTKCVDGVDGGRETRSDRQPRQLLRPETFRHSEARAAPVGPYN